MVSDTSAATCTHAFRWQSLTTVTRSASLCRSCPARRVCRSCVFVCGRVPRVGLGRRGCQSLPGRRCRLAPYERTSTPAGADPSKETDPDCFHHRAGGHVARSETPGSWGDRLSVPPFTDAALLEGSQQRSARS